MVFAIASIAKGAPFINSKKKSIDAMLALADVRPGVVSIDIGSGSGPVVMAFARAGARASGCEINLLLVLWSRLRIWIAGLSGNATVRWGNLWREDLSRFEIVSVYGIPFIMTDLEKKLILELKPGAKVISNSFQFPNLPIVKQVDSVYLYVIDKPVTIG
jgi:hypothetical protein